MREIIIKKGEEKFISLIDESDYEKVSKLSWFYDKNGYATTTKKKNGKSITIRLHSFILGSKKGYEIDHINNNKLDNRKENLRHVTHQQNCLNRKLGKPHYDKSRNQWKARIKIKSKEIFFGRFKTYEEAELVLNKERVKYFQDFNYSLVTNQN